MTDSWDELWKEEKYMTSENVPTDFYNLMLKIKAEGDKLKYYADWVKRLENFKNINFHQKSMALGMSCAKFLEMKRKAEIFDKMPQMIRKTELKNKIEAVKTWAENYVDPYLEMDESNITLFRSEGLELKKILDDQTSSQEATEDG